MSFTHCFVYRNRKREEVISLQMCLL